MYLRLVALAWGGGVVAPGFSLKRQKVKVEEFSNEGMFRRLLNSNQLADLDKPWEAYAFNSDWKVKSIRVYGSRGSLWNILFFKRTNEDKIYVQLRDPVGRSRCFHVTENFEDRHSLNDREPWLAAASFLLSVQADETWVNNVAGDGW